VKFGSTVSKKITSVLSSMAIFAEQKKEKKRRKEQNTKGDLS